MGLPMDESRLRDQHSEQREWKRHKAKFFKVHNQRFAEIIANGRRRQAKKFDLTSP